MINFNSKVYLVYVEEDEITVFKGDQVSIAQSLYGETEFSLKPYNSPSRFKRENKYLSITDKEIAELFISDKETIEQE